MTDIDHYAGIGGSYILNPDGTRELKERTGDQPDAKPEPPAPAKADAKTKPESQP